MKNDTRYQPPPYNDSELLQFFPEARKIIPIKIKECLDAMNKEEQKIRRALENLYKFKTDAFSEWFCEEIIKTFMMPDLKKLEKTLFKLKHMHHLLNPKIQSGDVYNFQEKIESAKQYPIEELARSTLDYRQVGKNLISLCPFHNEKTPSFYIYPDSNRYYCFGCQESGDVIKLSMALHGINFKEAVEMLQN
jgi:hypothetical protein